MRTIFLLSHTPIPRFIKRMDVSNKVSKTKLIYWDRKLKDDIKFTLPKDIDSDPVRLRSPQGKTFTRSFLLLIFGVSVIKKINKNKPNNLHIGNFDMLLIAYIYKIFFNKKVNIIYEIGDLPNIVFKNNILSLLFSKAEKLMIKKVNILILTSPYFWDHYYKKITDESKYYFIPNVPSVEILKDKNINRPLNSKFTIGFIGSIRYKEQLMMLIDSVKGNNHIDVLIAGTGINLQEIKDYSYAYNNIIFTGSYDYKDISVLYGKVDIIYSVYDTKKSNVKIALPNRLYESILHEKPLIVARDTELAKFVLDKDIGYAVTDGNAQELTRLIDFLYGNHQSINSKRFHCKSIKDKYVYESFIPVIESFYK